MSSKGFSIVGILAAALAIGAAGCSKEEKQSAVPVSPWLTPPDGDATGDEVKPLTIGVETGVKGDVLADENGQFSLTRTFSFTLAEETALRVRKSFANGNCGSPTGNFFVLKGEEQVAGVTIDPAKSYEGVPKEQLPEPLAAGDYLLVAHITLDAECKSMMFYYDFVLEKAP